ncbi:MAG: DUF885 domain-containing protein, partial [Planctomycetes bacterium]|nr:DUF885 domain-containing protein [Planctomycetota bacterium]
MFGENQSLRISIAVVLCVVGAMVGCSTPGDRAAAIFEDYWQQRLRHSPTWSTYVGEHRYNDRLDDLSESEAAAWTTIRRDLLGQLARVSRLDLSDADRGNCTILERELRDGLSVDECNQRLMPLKHQGSPHLTLPMLLVSHPFSSERDYRDYIKRLRGWPTQVDQVIANSREGMRRGFVRSRVIIEKVVPQLRAH